MAIEHSKKDFTALYERENDALFRFCLWRVSNRETALEMTQETFARLWGKMAGGINVEHPRAFIYVTARHLIIDWYRKTKSSSLEALSEYGDRPFDPVDENAHTLIETSSDAKRALLTINKLEDQYREVVYLSFVEDLPPREIAQILNITPNAVSIRLTRGLDALRRLTGIDKIER
jgi:RNA polymerase sigma factor (sigma-70 family)